MLVLTRRSGESILIGEEVRVRVLGSSSTRVRLGIEAPLDVRILREKAEPNDRPEPPSSAPHTTSDGPLAATVLSRTATVPTLTDRKAPPK